VFPQFEGIFRKCFKNYIFRKLYKNASCFIRERKENVKVENKINNTALGSKITK